MTIDTWKDVSHDTDPPLNVQKPLELISRLFVQRKFENAHQECIRLLDQFDILTSDQRNVLLLMLLRISKEVGQWNEAWQKVCQLIGGSGMLSEELLLLGSLKMLKEKEYKNTLDLIETWLTCQTDEYMARVASNMQPSARNYRRIVELYLLSLVGAHDYSAALAFLQYNTILGSQQKKTLEEYVVQLQNEEKALLTPVSNTIESTVVELPPVTTDLIKPTFKTRRDEGLCDPSVQSINQISSSTEASFTQQPVSEQPSTNITPVSKIAPKSNSKTILARITETMIRYAKYSQKRHWLISGIFVMLVLLMWISRKMSILQHKGVIYRILSIAGNRLLTTARMGINAQF
ncbi:hypothetical protein O5D80_008230 [Batrachochytrium dendrobatidis]|nr:hypothetical protein O5D80_008230 [Batrachochytrium dendrobatidis]